MKPIEPILLKGTVSARVPTSAELLAAATRAEARLTAGDRGGAYLELYLVTGNEQLLLHAQITTYSGAPGGMAQEGNYQAKIARPDVYKLTLDDFSHQIDATVVKLAKDMAEGNTPELFTTQAIRDVTKEVWNDKGMTKLFPGNAQWIGVDPDIADTIGGHNAVLAQDEAELGRRPAEYRNNPNYTIHEPKDGRFITVVNNKTNCIEVFFDKEFDSTRGTAVDSSWRITDADLEQIPNEIPEKRILSERRLKMQHLQAGEMKPQDDLAKFNPGAPKLPANLDRVFLFDGKLYQLDDHATLEHKGVDLSRLLRGNPREGTDYIFALRQGGVGSFVDLVTGKSDRPRMFFNEQTRQLFNEQERKLFTDLTKKGVIKALSDEETTNYTNAVKQLNKDELPSPFEKQSEAFMKLRLNLLSPVQQRFGLNEQAPGEKTTSTNDQPVVTTHAVNFSRVPPDTKDLRQFSSMTIEQRRTYLARETYLEAGFVPKEEKEAGEWFLVKGGSLRREGIVQLFAASDMQALDPADSRNPAKAVEDLYMRMAYREQRTQTLERPQMTEIPVPPERNERERDKGPELG